MKLARYEGQLPVSEQQLRALRAYAQNLFMTTPYSVEEVWFRASIRLLEEMKVIKHLDHQTMLEDASKQLKFESETLEPKKQLKFNIK